MGDNSAYTAFESITIGIYNNGMLNATIMKVIMEAWRNSDIDSGGSMGLRTNDGKEVEQVACEAFGVEIPPRPDLPGEWRDWTPEQQAECEAWQDLVSNEFYKIRKQFEWW